MFAPLQNPAFQRLFAAQIVALLGTGLLTVALGLLAWDLAGADAGLVLGTALAIKMIAYVGVAPVAAALAEFLPRRAMLIGLDLIRACVALALPHVDQVWQIYLLIFLLQASSAAFTPAFQATIPDILLDEQDYTEALSLSRLAYDLENLLSPMLAAALLTVMSFHWLFAGTVVGFAFSALLIASVVFPPVSRRSDQQTFLERTTRGIRNYLATPRLRGLLALNLAAASGGAMVIVNTVVYVRQVFGGSESDVAIALGAFGAGSMVSALLLPRVLEWIDDRSVMVTAASTLVLALLATGVLAIAGRFDWYTFLVVWFVLGASYSAILTPGGRLLRRSCHPEDRPALFAAQFALSHACWLLTYPLAGRLGAAAGLEPVVLILAGLAGIGLLTALIVWPAHDPVAIAHDHPGLPSNHPHLRDAPVEGRRHNHEHAFVIDEHHRSWPTS